MSEPFHSALEKIMHLGQDKAWEGLLGRTTASQEAQQKAKQLAVQLRQNHGKPGFQAAVDELSAQLQLLATLGVLSEAECDKLIDNLQEGK